MGDITENSYNESKQVICSEEELYKREDKVQASDDAESLIRPLLVNQQDKHTLVR